MKKALKWWGVLTGIYFAIAVVMLLTLREMDTLILYTYLAFGVPLLIGCLLLTILYYKMNREAFLKLVAVLCVLLMLVLLYETFYVPYKIRKDIRENNWDVSYLVKE